MAIPEALVPTKSPDMLLGSPRFIKVNVKDGRGNVLSPPSVVPGQGEVWLTGETVLKTGEVIASVFAIDTDRGGTLPSGWWHLDGRWFPVNDEGALAFLGRSDEDVTPWNWRYTLPVEKDMYHD